MDVADQEGHRQSRVLPLLLPMVDSGHLQRHFPLTADSVRSARWGRRPATFCRGVSTRLNVPVSSGSGGGIPLRDHPAASWDPGHRGVWGHLAHAAAGHRPLSDRVHRDPQIGARHGWEETQVKQVEFWGRRDDSVPVLFSTPVFFFQTTGS